MSTASISELREHLLEYLSRAEESGERVTVIRDGEAVAALVPLRDLELLRAIEDRLDNEEADEALREASEAGFIPWERVQADAS